MYDGTVNTTAIANVITTPCNNTIQDIGNLHLEDLNCFIDTLLQKKDHTVKQFTNADLKAHVNQHWQLTIQVQMDSGASDCITPDQRPYGYTDINWGLAYH